MQGGNIVKINKPCPTKDLYFKTFWNWTDSSSYYRSSSHQLFHELCLPSRQSGHQLSPIWSPSSNIDPINITTICFPLCSSSVSFRFWSPSTWICNCLGSDIFPLRWPRFQLQLSYFSYPGGVRHDPQRFMGKTVTVPHFNRDTVEFASRMNQTQGSKHCCLFRKTLLKRAISRIFKIS